MNNRGFVLTSTLGTVVKWTLLSSILLSLFVFVPFSIGIPNDVYNFITSGAIKKVFNSLYYFFPVDFAVSCFLILLLARHGQILWNMISWVFDKIKSSLS